MHEGALVASDGLAPPVLDYAGPADASQGSVGPVAETVRSKVPIGVLMIGTFGVWGALLAAGSLAWTGLVVLGSGFALLGGVTLGVGIACAEAIVVEAGLVHLGVCSVTAATLWLCRWPLGDVRSSLSSILLCYALILTSQSIRQRFGRRD